MRRYITCRECGRHLEHYAHGLCNACYKRATRTTKTTRQPTRQPLDINLDDHREYIDRCRQTTRRENDV